MDTESLRGSCNLCGGADFTRGPSGRLSSTGRLPCCVACHSLERDRIAHRVFDRMGREHTIGKRLLRLGSDHGPSPSWFALLTISPAKSPKDLDREVCALPAGSFDWIYASDALHHSADAALTLREMQRVVGERGVVTLSLTTRLADALRRAVPDWTVLELVAADLCTASIDSIYVFSRDEELLQSLAHRLVADNIHVRLLAAPPLARAAELVQNTEQPRPPQPQPAVKEETPAKLTAGVPCNVCGGLQFSGGPSNRLSSNGRAPRCACCGALERNRVMRRVFDAMPPETRHGRLLQLGVEPGVPEDWFREARVLPASRRNELAELGEGRFEWLCAYHLLNDGPDEGSDLADMLRCVGTHGIVALSLRGSAGKYEQVELLASESDLPRANSAFVKELQQKMPQVTVLELVTVDPCTETIDAVYFCSEASAELEKMSQLVVGTGVYPRLFTASQPLPTSAEARPRLVSRPPPAFSSPASTGDGWQRLHGEIQAAKGKGRRIRFWVRDDDAVSETPALLELLDLCGAEDIPIALAVIPEKADEALRRAIVGRPGVSVLQHGFDHKNRSLAGEKSEFPDTRVLDEALGTVREGWTRLSDRFADQAMAVFVPPWGTCALAVRRGLAGVGLFGYSGSPVGPFQPRELCRRGQPRTSMGLSLVCTHLAVNRAIATDTSPLPIDRHLTQLTNVVNAIRLDDTDPNEPIGIMTHAWGVDAGVRDFLRELFRVTRDAGATWADARQLFRE